MRILARPARCRGSRSQLERAMRTARVGRSLAAVRPEATKRRSPPRQAPRARTRRTARVRASSDLLDHPADRGREQRLVTVAWEQDGHEVSLGPLHRALSELRMGDHIADPEIRRTVFGEKLFDALEERCAAVVACPAIRTIVFLTEIIEDELAAAAARFAILQHHRKLALVVRFLGLVAGQIQRTV